MDSGERKGVSSAGGNVSQDDIKKFEEFLKENILKMGGGRFFESSVTELDKRFLELIFKMPIFSLLDKLEVRKICPDVLKVYLEKNKKNIISILLKNKNFLDSLINAYIDNMVSLFGIIKDTQKKSKTVQQSGMRNFELIKQNVNAENHEHDNALDVMRKQQTYLSDEFDVVNTLWTMISNSSQVNDAQIAILDVISRLFAKTYKNTYISQYIVARQLDLTQQANENAREANKRADEANKRADEANESAREANKRADEANKRADEANESAREANKRADDADKKVDKLQQEIKQLKTTTKRQQRIVEVTNKKLEAQNYERVCEKFNNNNRGINDGKQQFK